MEDLPKLVPYVIEEVLSSDNFYTHYKADHEEKNHTYIITEFTPSFMISRTKEGDIEVVERFAEEYEGALNRFIKMGETLHGLREPFVTSVEELIKFNNTAYIVRKQVSCKSVEESFKTQKIDYNNAYALLRPLVQTLAAACKKGLLFQFAPGDLRVDPYGQLVLNSMFAWNADCRHTITQIAETYYLLVAGVTYDPEISKNPTIDSLDLPVKLAALLKNILTEESSYGSIEDFSKQLRRVMETESKNDKLEKFVNNNFVEPKIIKKEIVAGILAGVVILSALFISFPLAQIFISNWNEERGDHGYFQTQWEEEVNATLAVFTRLHTAYAVTDPRDPTVMLNGSFYSQGQVLYHRTYQGGYGLSRRVGTGLSYLLASNVRPAFITSHGEYIFFSDGLEDYSIRRVRIDGSGLETVSSHTASFLHIYENELFYTNHSNRDFLYRMDLSTFESRPFLKVAAYEALIRDGHLYFINGSSGFRIYKVPIDQHDYQPVRVNQANSDNLRLQGRHIFYRDVENSTVNRFNYAGFTDEVMLPMAVASFDISGPTIAIVEVDTHELWLYDMNTQELGHTGLFAAYAMAGFGNAYIIDYNDVRINRLAESAMVLGLEASLEYPEHEGEIYQGEIED